MSLCSCQSGKELSDCCEPFIKGQKLPQLASELMRARYTAYTLGDIDFIRDSHDPNTRSEFDYQAAKSWASQSEWVGLKIVDKDQGRATDDWGMVEFVASFKDKAGNVLSHHEQAEFEKQDNRWFYTDGEMVSTAPITRAQPKIGRNDPCHCGSGKKFKKCHGA